MSWKRINWLPTPKSEPAIAICDAAGRTVAVVAPEHPDCDRNASSIVALPDLIEMAESAAAGEDVSDRARDILTKVKR